jgi:hypothetical protein
LGDFDFFDPKYPEKGGKQAKGHMGAKTNPKTQSLDVPGPGSYEIDVYPSNQKNIGFCFGLGTRRELGVPNAQEMPGPG